MKILRNISALGLSALLAITLAVPVKADDTAIKKTYNATGSGASPAETFTFTSATLKYVSDTAYNDASNITAKKDVSGITDIPEAIKSITIPSVSYNEGQAGGTDKTKNMTITLPSGYTRTGLYYYEFKETAGNTAGVTYDDNSYELVVRVTREGTTYNAAIAKLSTDGKKYPDLTNTYENGQLTFKKEITGNAGDLDQAFNVKVTLAAPTGKTVKSNLSVNATNSPETVDTSVAAGDGWTTKELSYKVKNDTEINITNLPAGVTYKVEETDANTSGYTTSYQEGLTTVENISGTISANTTDSATIINNKGTTIDTGVFTPNLPYVLIIGAGVVLIILMIRNKRKNISA